MLIYCIFCITPKPLLRPLTPLLSAFSTPIHPIPAADLLPLEFALDVRRDPQFSSVPEAIHFSGEVFGELVRVDHQNGFVVGVGGRGGPVERSCDHFFVVDYSELVMQHVAAGEAWGANIFEAFVEGLVVLFKFAVAIR